MPFLITPKVENLFANLPEGVTQDILRVGEFDSLEQAQAVAAQSLQNYPGVTRVISEIKVRLTAEVQVSAAVEAPVVAAK